MWDGDQDGRVEVGAERGGEIVGGVARQLKALVGREEWGGGLRGAQAGARGEERADVGWAASQGVKVRCVVLADTFIEEWLGYAHDATFPIERPDLSSCT